MVWPSPATFRPQTSRSATEYRGPSKPLTLPEHISQYVFRATHHALSPVLSSPSSLLLAAPAGARGNDLPQPPLARRRPRRRHQSALKAPFEANRHPPHLPQGAPSDFWQGRLRVLRSFLQRRLWRLHELVESQPQRALKINWPHAAKPPNQSKRLKFRNY